jgi:hypothetical protein
MNTSLTAMLEEFSLAVDLLAEDLAAAAEPLPEAEATQAALTIARWRQELEALSAVLQPLSQMARMGRVGVPGRPGDFQLRKPRPIEIAEQLGRHGPQSG